MKVEPASVEDYLASLPDDRREAIATVRKTVLENLQPGFEECIQYGMISYAIPHSIYPAGYHCDPKQPVPFACMGNQKNYVSLHLMCLYMQSPLLDWFQAEWAKTGKKLDMGKACVRFKKADDLALGAVGELFAKVSVDDYLAIIEKSRTERR
ncbi:MAG TPA: DUF1801 domain-containing protein [Fimbriimonadales bacterium]|jgi:hypothetical protein|nr:DUF1801 domain-containing protein [Fimbriimonadales bacterium]